MKKIKISLILNILIVLFTIFASISMFTGFKFMTDTLMLESSSISMFRFFTVDSNILMGIVSLIFSIYEIRLINGRKKEIPESLYIAKLMATSAVTLTFVVVFAYLGLMTGYFAMIQNSNLFFHLITPLLSIITFTCFEKTNLNFKQSLYGIIPTFLYEIFYLTNLLMHIENGKVNPIYDWYWFVQGGVYQIFIVAPLMLLISFIISALLWKGNKSRL